MRHLVAGRKLGRNASHRKAMFRNMAVSLIKTCRILEGEPGQPKVAGRIVTTNLRKSGMAAPEKEDEGELAVSLAGSGV